MSVMGQLMDANFTSPNCSNSHEAAHDVESTENGTDEIEEHRDAMDEHIEMRRKLRICGTSVTRKRKRPPATLERVKRRAKERCTMGLDIEHVVDTASGHTRRNIG